MFLSKADPVTPKPAPTHWSDAGNSTCGGLQGSMGFPNRTNLRSVLKSLRISLRWKSTREDTRMKGHLFVCVCDKGLFQTSDLRGYQQVRAGEKRLRCSAWVMSFSHRANRLAQERTRTGEREALWVPCATDTASTAPPPAATRGCARELLSDTLLPHQKLPRLQPRM